MVDRILVVEFDGFHVFVVSLLPVLSGQCLFFCGGLGGKSVSFAASAETVNAERSGDSTCLLHAASPSVDFSSIMELVNEVFQTKDATQ